MERERMQVCIMSQRYKRGNAAHFLKILTKIGGKKWFILKSFQTCMNFILSWKKKRRYLAECPCLCKFYIVIWKVCEEVAERWCSRSHILQFRKSKHASCTTMSFEVSFCCFWSLTAPGHHSLSLYGKEQHEHSTLKTKTIYYWK